MTPYHSRKHSSRKDTVPPEEREFIAWDGEGLNLDGPEKPQSYVLFGCSAEDIEPLKSDSHIPTMRILDYMISVAQVHRNAFHVGFAFGYDGNMILRSLPVEKLKEVHKTNTTTIRKKDGTRYYIHFIPKKWFSVTRFEASYDKQTNSSAKTHLKIYDLFGFFAKKFTKAYEELIGPVPQAVKEGKESRDDFYQLGIEYVERYWRIEIQMLRELAEELRNRLYNVDLRITQWHGPGALASYVLRKHRIQDAKSVCPRPVRTAAKYGYAGGRFEIFRLGRTSGKTIYSLDINSAYPYGISQLPNLRSGTWSHVSGTSKKLAKFGIYRVRLLPTLQRPILGILPGPLFHRDHVGNISYPWVLEGWYWSPEVRNLRRLDPSTYTILEGWEYTGWKTNHLPFSWVKEVYDERRRLKEVGDGSQLALKLLLNSLYGKMAQRVGWNEDLKLPPTWHQLEWAGWVTSLCRAMLWDLMSQIPFEDLIAVETDGLYTTMPPQNLGISNSKSLGKWEIQEYDEIMYVQSGMAWLRRGDKWSCKRRGLDTRTFSIESCISYLHSLTAQQVWAPFTGETTRFIGVGAALASSTPMKDIHCVWHKSDRQIKPGQNGKRVHLYKQCRACTNNHSAYEEPHDMSIKSIAYNPKHLFSSPHDIPWDDDEAIAWRAKQETMGDSYGRI